MIRTILLGAILVGGAAGCESLGHTRDTPVLPDSSLPNFAAAAPADTAAAGGNIDLPSALEIGGADNPTINLAREAVREAEAQRLGANALVLPTVDLGVGYHHHTGNLQRSSGAILDVNSQNLFFGAGSLAGNAAVPGIRLFYPLADIVAERRVAAQRVAGRQADSAAVQIAILRDAAEAYLRVVGADAALAEQRRSEGDFAEIVRLTAAYAKARQGREADANRALTALELLRRQIEDFVWEREAASARLAEILNLDPMVPLIPTGGPLVPLSLIDASTDVDTLVARAEAYRPELAARAAEVAQAQIRVRQEEWRPWVPTLTAALSAGGFGGGNDTTAPEFGRFGTRTDFDVAAIWTLQNFGFGNRALVLRNRAVVGQTAARLRRTRDEVREQVTEARTQVLAAAAQIDIARRQLAIAEQGYREESARIREGQGLPLEVLDSATSLQESRLELVRSITEHNRAQFRLLAAVGTSPALAVAPGR